MVHTRKLGYLSPCEAGGRVPLLAHFLLFLLLLLTASAHAAPPTVKAYFVNSSITSGPVRELGPLGNASAACSAFIATIKPQESIGYSMQRIEEDVSAFICFYRVMINGSYVQDGTTSGVIRLMCPGLVPPGPDGQCDGEVCKAGAKRTLNFTAGYHATPATNVKLNPIIKADPFVKQLQKDGGATMCHEGCKVGVPPAEEGDYWISQVAGPNGLYRSSADIEVTSTSQQCTEATPDAVTSAASPPACPGTTGTVNGATVCLPSTTDSGVDMGGEATRGNPSAGSVDPNKTPAERAAGPGGAGNGSGSGNSSNGGGPTGGPATGSNNSSGGKGCNDGTRSPTPACSGKGVNDADGNTDKPGDGKEQANCGAPGQPKCAIDETGTPDGKGVFDKADKGVTDEWAKKKTELDKFMNGGDKDTSWGVMPSWLHTGGCSPWSLGTLPVINVQIVIDICPIKTFVDLVMGFLWAVGTFFAVTSLVFRTTTQSGS